MCNKKGIYINCLNCNKEFYITPYYLGKRKYCSAECGLLGQKIARKGVYKRCIVCDKEYYVMPSGIETRKYCSQKCSKVEISNRNGSYKNCLVCNKEFYVPKYREEGAKYCSTECLNHGQYKVHEKTCEGCGEIFHVSNSRIRRKYCTPECKTLKSKKEKEIRKQSQALVILRRGRNSGRSLKNLFRQAGIPLKCEHCGYDKAVHNIEMHHIDKNPNNNKLENISCLCVMCHRDLHWGSLEYKNGKYYDSSTTI